MIPLFDDYYYDISSFETELELKPGDTYEDIAREFETTIEALAFNNPHINLEQVTPGQRLRVPIPQQRLCSGRIYIVREGDTLSGIARRFRVSEAELRRANPLLLVFGLRSGLPLCIPDSIPVPVCPGGFIYTIRAGDTFSTIAARYRITVDALLRANPGVNPNRLFIGQQICIPAVPVPRPPVCPGGVIHTVMFGDTLFSLASRYRTSVDAILRANPGLDPNRIFVGQQICIPASR